MQKDLSAVTNSRYSLLFINRCSSFFLVPPNKFGYFLPQPVTTSISIYNCQIIMMEDGQFTKKTLFEKRTLFRPPKYYFFLVCKGRGGRPTRRKSAEPQSWESPPRSICRRNNPAAPPAPRRYTLNRSALFFPLAHIFFLPSRVKGKKSDCSAA